MAPTRALLVLLCAVYAWGTLVPNEYVKTKDGKSTSIVTGIYYSLFNYGQIEKQRGGLITFYVNDDPDNQGIHDDLTYKTLALDNDDTLNPGGRNYEATLFSLKRIQGNAYQLWNKKLQGPVTYKKLNADEFTLVIHGVESNMHQQLKKPGKLFNTTLFTLTKVNDLPGYYQLESADLNAVIDYNGNVPSFPRDLLINRNSKEAKQNPKNNTSRQGSYFRFNLADFYDTVPLITKVDYLSEDENQNVAEESVILLDTINKSDLPATHNLVYVFNYKNSTTLTEGTQKHGYFYVTKYYQYTSDGKSKVIQEPPTTIEGKSIVEVNTQITVLNINKKYTVNTNKDDAQTISLDIQVVAPPQTRTNVILTIIHKKGSRKCVLRNLLAGKGDRLKEDGSYTDGFGLDVNAIYEIQRSKGHGKEISKKNGKVYRTWNALLNWNMFDSYDVVHNCTDYVEDI